MIEYDVWIDGIVSTCQLISDEEVFRKAWLENDKSITSIINYDELYEQIFDDLDSDAYERLLPSMEKLSDNKRKLISRFLCSLREFDKETEQDEQFKSPDTLLGSVEWNKVRVAAMNVVNG